jgi:tetratricopeptide (TPR) repeat protein
MLDPDSPAALFKRCCRFLMQGNPCAALLLPKLEKYPDFASGWEDLGTTLERAGQSEAAGVSFLRAAAAYIRAETSNPAAASLAQGRCLRRAGRLDEAVAAFSAAVAQDLSLAEAWFSLGLAQQDRGMRQEAIVAFAQALVLRPCWHEAALNLGVAWQEAGDLERAIDAYAIAYTARPEALARIAQALATGRTGRVWLNIERLRRLLHGQVAVIAPGQRENASDRRPDY